MSLEESWEICIPGGGHIDLQATSAMKTMKNSAFIAKMLCVDKLSYPRDTIDSAECSYCCHRHSFEHSLLVIALYSVHYVMADTVAIDIGKCCPEISMISVC